MRGWYWASYEVACCNDQFEQIHAGKGKYETKIIEIEAVKV